MLDLPRSSQDAILSRVKVLGKMDIAERRSPQDGRASFRYADREIDVRMSVIPTDEGERAVLRLLDKEQKLLKLEEVGLSDRNLTEFERLINMSHGMILVTGPTGSGKTTTLYAALMKINSPEQNIITIEDPVEYKVPGIGQCRCWPIRGEGGTVGPDLGSERPLPRTLTQMAGRMWNHSPEMWAAMKTKGIKRPTFEGAEMADLIAFLYSVRYFELGGSPIVGQELFNERKCSQCHGSDAGGGKIGPNLRKVGKVYTPVNFALALWSHGPRMYAKAEELGLDWPTLNEGDLSHLLAFLNSSPVQDKK